MEHVDVKKQAQYLLAGAAERPQDDRGRQLAPPVYAHEQAVLGVELEVQPGAAVGNHPRRIQQLAGTMGLALVVAEENPRRAVQLGDHHPLRAVDDESAVFRHERHFAHIDFLLLDVLDRLAGGLPVVDDEAHLHPQGRSVGDATHHAFLDVESRLAELVVNVLDRRVAGVADDGKHRPKRRMQALLPALVGGRLHLQELAVGIHLNRKEVGHLHGLGNLAEILADAFFLGEAIGHSNLLGSSFRTKSKSRNANRRRGRPKGETGPKRREFALATPAAKPHAA